MILNLTILQLQNFLWMTDAASCLELAKTEDAEATVDIKFREYNQ